MKFILFKSCPLFLPAGSVSSRGLDGEEEIDGPVVAEERDHGFSVANHRDLRAKAPALAALLDLPSVEHEEDLLTRIENHLSPCDWSREKSNFMRPDFSRDHFNQLVLGCIDVDFANQMVIFQH